jgi:hypothetical protein
MGEKGFSPLVKETVSEMIEAMKAKIIKIIRVIICVIFSLLIRYNKVIAKI